MSSPPRHCPICNKLEQSASRPFCSERCRQLDLGKWLKGDYAIPAVEADGDEEAGDVLPDDRNPESM